MRSKLLIGICLVAGLIVSAIVGFLIWRSKRAGPTGLVVHLYTNQKEFRLGEPIRFSVVVINTSMRTVARDFQTFGLGAFEITGPDGHPVHNVEPWSQTMADNQPLPPLGRYYVHCSTDVLREHSILKEGNYTIRVKSLGKDLPASNKLRFTVSGGSPPPTDVMLDNIRTVLPNRWHAGRYHYKYEPGPPPGRKAPECLNLQLYCTYPRARVDVFITKDPAPEDPNPREGVEVASFLGRNAEGCFYINTSGKTSELWPSHVADLKKVLNIK